MDLARFLSNPDPFFLQLRGGSKSNPDLVDLGSGFATLIKGTSSADNQKIRNLINLMNDINM